MRRIVSVKQVGERRTHQENAQHGARYCAGRLAVIISLLRDYNRITKRYTFGLVFATVDANGAERPVLVVRGLTECKARQVLEAMK